MLRPVLASLLVLTSTLSAYAEPKKSGLGLDPGVPNVVTLPGGFTPVGSEDAEEGQGWSPDFHGFLNMPLILGLNTRSGPVTSDQYSTVFHAPPVVPEYRDAFTYTAALPAPYIQLNFSYGNSIVAANVILQARATQTASTFFDPSTRGAITDAYLTFKGVELSKNARLVGHIGAFTNRYGIMGAYDEGKYSTPVIARINGVGENIVAQLKFGDFGLELQQGFQGQLDKAPLGIVPGDWNEYADANLGTGLASHFHGGLSYKDIGTLGLHYIYAWTADDRASQGKIPDGKISILGADTRFSLKRFGHLYAGVSLTDAKDSRSVGRIVEVLNTLGGPGLMRNYFGPNTNGTGKLFTAAFQYDLSVARLLYSDRFYGKSPDIVLGLFGMMTNVDTADTAYGGRTKFKMGAEAGYSILSWLATSVRFDHVTPDSLDFDKSFSMLSPRIILRSDWQSHDQVSLQYTRYFNGNQVYVRNGTPAVYDPSINPDQDVLSVSATMWW